MKKNRRQFHTNIDKDIINKAKAVHMLLDIKGIKKDGVNELIEEGLEFILEKYKEENDLPERLLNL